LKHLDPIWFLMIFTPLHFWWGKPVQINPMYYRNPMKWELLVSLAWPATNLVLAIIGMIIILTYSKITGVAFTDILNMNMDQLDPMNIFWIIFAQLNIVLAVFNLIPIYPLDGYRLVKIFRKKLSDKMEMYPMYSMIIVIWIIFLWSWVISYIVKFIFSILFTFFWQLFY
jgi:Zn-dependent protease